ncbi:MAG TPA: hypothetical protein PKE47_16315 [Verrucomicrobiota bacterium]|nr:hypothetical protein [Verrucomicrobiota bacterium]
MVAEPIITKAPPAAVPEAAPCLPETCRRACAVEVVDGFLRTPGAVTGEEERLLLDFRSLLRRREDAEGTLRLFCDLRRRLEPRHYLEFYRLRRWLENHLVSEARACPAAPAQAAAVKLDFFCVEALRRAALCRALGPGTPVLRPRVGFRFAGA